mmetsp:Transcript_16837/g.43231  ORF Transcript_16837/g.43231 Transcript_16837/m.43231 type:complete len:283 (-) Transcript_16837:147-995(-)
MHPAGPCQVFDPPTLIVTVGVGQRSQCALRKDHSSSLPFPLPRAATIAAKKPRASFVSTNPSAFASSDVQKSLCSSPLALAWASYCSSTLCISALLSRPSWSASRLLNMPSASACSLEASNFGWLLPPSPAFCAPGLALPEAIALNVSSASLRLTLPSWSRSSVLNRSCSASPCARAAALTLSIIPCISSRVSWPSLSASSRPKRAAAILSRLSRLGLDASADLEEPEGKSLHSPGSPGPGHGVMGVFGGLILSGSSCCIFSNRRARRVSASTSFANSIDAC